MNTLDGGIALHTHRALADIAPASGIEPPEWTLAAVCPSVDPELFYPPKGGDTRAAKTICAGCPVRVECLTYAIVAEDNFGIYGGLTERERRRLRRDGWLPGHAAPEPRLRRGKVARTGRCSECCKDFVRLDEHVKRRHGYLRGVAVIVGVEPCAEVA